MLFINSRLVRTSVIGLVPALLATGEPYRGEDSETKNPSSSTSKEATGVEMGLEILVGHWAVVQTNYDRTGDVISTTEGREVNKWVLERSAVERNFRSEIGGKAYHARGVVHFVDAEKKLRGAWFDDVLNNEPTVVEGEWNEKTHVMVWTMDAPGPNGKKSRYRVVEKFLDSETRTATMFRLDGLDVVKVQQSNYTRTIPCPANIRALIEP